MFEEVIVGDNFEQISNEIERLKIKKRMKKDYYMYSPSTILYLEIRELVQVINSLERKLNRSYEYF